MRIHLTPALGAAAFAVATLLLLGLSDAAVAQSRTRTAAAPPARCLKAIDGSCVRPEIVEATRQRAAIIPAVRMLISARPRAASADLLPARTPVPGQPVDFRLADLPVRRPLLSEQF